MFAPLFQGLLAELEAEGEEAEGASQRIDEGLTLANETAERWTDARFHRLGGEILLNRDPANRAPAEEALLAGIAVAQAQKAKGSELWAALSLCRLFQSSGRLADAYTVLAPVFVGFSPTQEMPEIAEAQALLGSLGVPEQRGTAPVLAVKQDRH